MKFSQRIGKTSIRNAIQIESIDIPLENKIWNTILTDLFDQLEDTNYYSMNEALKKQVCRVLWTEFFEKRIDEISTYSSGEIYSQGVVEYLKKWFFKCEWHEKYDLLEFLSKVDLRILNIGFTENCNIVLEKEMSGYRLIDENIVQITSEQEINEIEEAITNSSKWESVNIHLKTSIAYFSNRENPDYRNSVKEAISSVESLCIIITGDKNSTLGKALGIIEKKFKIHSALKSAFSSLYGYTSDSGGIRHSLLEDDIIVTMEDAKFMLVSCSAFINYLQIKFEK
jgi:hypothetical protein